MTAPRIRPGIATRREFLAVLGASGLLAACGRPAPDDAPAPSRPVTVTHAGGETTFSAVPQRVVILDDAMLGDVLAFGIVPVGTAAGAGDPTVIETWRGEAGVADIPLVAPDFAPNLEAVAAVRPDAILAMAFQVEEPYWTDLGRLAPTVAVETDVNPEALDVRFDEVALRLYAQIFRRPERAEEIVDAYRERVAQLRSRFAAVIDGRTVGFATSYDDGTMRADVATGWAGAVLADLGFGFPAAQTAALDPEFPVRVEFSAEEAPRFLGDCDLLIWREDRGSGAAVPGLPPAAAAANPLLAGLPAVTGGQVFTVSERVWFLRSVRGRSVVLDDLTDVILPALRP